MALRAAEEAKLMLASTVVMVEAMVWLMMCLALAVERLASEMAMLKVTLEVVEVFVVVSRRVVFVNDSCSEVLWP